MLPQFPQSQERALRPVAQHFDKDGAATIPLSPTRSIRNAHAIYEKIKDLPDQTPLRADYDRTGRPFIYLPRLKKNSIQSAREPLQAANEHADRQEVLNIMLTIAQDVQSRSNSSKEERLAAMRFGLAMRSKNVLGELRVGDVREALAALTGVPRHEVPSPSVGHRASAFRAHLVNFIAMPDYLKQILANALAPGHTSGGGQSLSAVEAMFTLIRQFLAQHPSGHGRAFLSYVNRYPLSDELIKFAWQWKKLLVAKQTTAGFLFRQMPWAREIRFAASIIKALAKRNDCWLAPERLAALRISTPAAQRGAVASSPVDSNSPTRPSLPQADLTSDEDVRSSPVQAAAAPVATAPSGGRSLYARPVMSDVLVLSEADQAPEVGKVSQTMADASVSDVFVSESEDFMPSLLDNIEWLPLAARTDTDDTQE